jgi:hypothetical protein
MKLHKLHNKKNMESEYFERAEDQMAGSKIIKIVFTCLIPILKR